MNFPMRYPGARPYPQLQSERWKQGRWQEFPCYKLPPILTRKPFVGRDVRDQSEGMAPKSLFIVRLGIALATAGGYVLYLCSGIHQRAWLKVYSFSL